MMLVCLIKRVQGGLPLQPTAENLDAPSVFALPPRFVPSGEDAEHMPYTTLDDHAGQVVGLDLVAGTVTTFNKKKKRK